MKNLALIIILGTMSSCVYHSGLITSTPVSSIDKNCEYVDIAVGYSNVSYFFGIGGFNKDAFLNEAKRNLYFSYPIKKWTIIRKYDTRFENYIILALQKSRSHSNCGCY